MPALPSLENRGGGLKSQYRQQLAMQYTIVISSIVTLSQEKDNKKHFLS